MFDRNRRLIGYKVIANCGEHLKMISLCIFKVDYTVFLKTNCTAYFQR